MEPQKPPPQAQASTDSLTNDRMPDESRRRVLAKLGKATILVPVVTLIADASTNLAAAS